MAAFNPTGGRGRDTALARVGPAQQQLLRRAGGSGKINPRTGLREYQGGCFVDPRVQAGMDRQMDEEIPNEGWRPPQRPSAPADDYAGRGARPVDPAAEDDMLAGMRSEEALRHPSGVKSLSATDPAVAADMNRAMDMESDLRTSEAQHYAARMSGGAFVTPPHKPPQPSGRRPVAAAARPRGGAFAGPATTANDLNRAEAARLAARGRGGDTELVHVNPQEVSLLKSAGGSGTTNPSTGLREFYTDAFGGGFGNADAVDAGGTRGEAGFNTPSNSTHDPMYAVGPGADKNVPGSAANFQANYGLTAEQAQAAAAKVASQASGTGGSVGGIDYGKIAKKVQAESASLASQPSVESSKVTKTAPATATSAPLAGAFSGAIPPEVKRPTIGNEEQAISAIAPRYGMTPDQMTQAAGNMGTANHDYQDEGNSTLDNIGNFLASQFGFNEMDPTNPNKNSLKSFLNNDRANWGFDPSGAIGTAVGAAAGVPLLGTAFNLASKILDRPLEIGLGPDVFGGQPPATGGPSPNANKSWLGGVADSIGSAFGGSAGAPAVSAGSDSGATGNTGGGVVTAPAGGAFSNGGGQAGSASGTGGQKGSGGGASGSNGGSGNIDQHAGTLLDHITGSGSGSGSGSKPTSPAPTTGQAGVSPIVLATPPATTSTTPTVTSGAPGAFVPFTGDYTHYGQTDPGSFQGEHIFFSNLPGNPQSNGTGPGAGSPPAGGGSGGGSGGSAAPSWSTVPKPPKDAHRWTDAYNQFLQNGDLQGYINWLSANGKGGGSFAKGGYVGSADGGDLVTRGPDGHYQAGPRLLQEVMRQESGGEADPNNATSSAGARGKMQLMPATAAEVAARLGIQNPDLTDEATNIRLGTAYLNQQLDANGGDIAKALWGYNAGPGSVLAGRMPDETKNYVGNIMTRLGMPGGSPTAGMSESDKLNYAQLSGRPPTAAPSPIAPRPTLATSPAAPTMPANMSESDRLNYAQLAGRAIGATPAFGPVVRPAAPPPAPTSTLPSLSEADQLNMAEVQARQARQKATSQGTKASPPGTSTANPVFAGGRSVLKDGSPAPLLGYRQPDGSIAPVNAALGGNAQSNPLGAGRGYDAGNNSNDRSSANTNAAGQASNATGAYGERGIGAGRYRGGGFIDGPQNDPVDGRTIHATVGEFIVKKDAAEAAGPRLLAAINSPRHARAIRSSLGL